jgi:hypothetical protein
LSDILLLHFFELLFPNLSLFLHHRELHSLLFKLWIKIIIDTQLIIVKLV